MRVLAAEVRYERLVARAFDKVRQAGRGMPAIMIRQLEALASIMQHIRHEEHRAALLEQAAMILQSSEASVPAGPDRDDVRRRYDRLMAVAGGVEPGQLGGPGPRGEPGVRPSAGPASR